MKNDVKDRMNFVRALREMRALIKSHENDEEWEDWLNEIYGDEEGWMKTKEYFTQDMWLDPAIEFPDN